MTAPTIRASSTDSGWGAGSPPSISVPVPTGTTAGDLLFLFVGGSSNSRTHTLDSTGWTVLQPWNSHGGGASGCNSTVYYKVAGTESGTYDVSADSAPMGLTGVCVAVKATTAGNIPTIDVISAVQSEGDSTAPSATAITTTENNCLVLSHLVLGDSVPPLVISANPGTEENSVNSAGTYDNDNSVWYETQATAGTTGTKNWTIDVAVEWLAGIITVYESINRVIELPLATVLLEAKVPNIAVDYNINVPIASLTSLTYAPSIVAGNAIELPISALNIVGLESTITADAVVELPLATIILTGNSPAIELLYNINCPVAALFIDGIVPTVKTYKASNRIIIFIVPKKTVFKVTERDTRVTVIKQQFKI